MFYNWELWESMLLKKIKRPLKPTESIGYCPKSNTICITVECGAEPSHSHIKLNETSIQTKLFEL